MLFVTLFPFAAFAVLMLVASAQVSLAVAASLSIALLIADGIRGRSMKVLQLTAATVFAGLFLYVTFVDGGLSAHWVRTVIDAAMLALGAGSLLLRAPFTMQYAVESVTPDIAEKPEFIRINYIITAVWTIACVAMLAANFATVLVPWMPLWMGIAVAFVARNGAAAFTKWYAQARRRQAAESIPPSAMKV